MRRFKISLTAVAVLGWILVSAGDLCAAKAKPARVDINSATQQELEALPGVGAATAKKIIEGRPYSSVSDLSKAGVSAQTIEKIKPLVTAGKTSARPAAEAAATEKPAAKSKVEKAAAVMPSGAKVDVNTASQQELEGLPGIGAATAKKIVAGRPYASVSDLSKAGVSARTIEKITPLVTVGKASAKPAAEAAAAEKPATMARAEKKAAAVAPSGAKVDLNTASQQELEALPGVGTVTARKIIEGRPYATASDLSKAGVSARTIEKITPLVTVGAKAAAAPPVSEASTAPAAKPAAAAAAPKATSSGTAASGMAQEPPAKGMVWVNTDTKVFHREGDRWYGNTKHGKYMTEADALKAGYRQSRQKVSN